MSFNWPPFRARKRQWLRWVLRLAAAFHLSPNLSKLLWHYSTHHIPSVLPDFLAFSLSLAARSVWVFLFRDPAAFLHFKRLGRAYRWVVCGTVALTTVPNGMVHVWALKAALKNNTLVLMGVFQATLAIIFLVPLAGLVWWMAWKFLLGYEESAEEFTPVVKNNMVATGRGGRHLTPTTELYRDNVSVSSTRIEVSNGYLSHAYEEQRLRTEEFPLSPGSAPPAGTPQLHEEVEGREQLPNEAPNATTTVDIAGPPRCQTISQFEYMPQSRLGRYSWLSDPIIPLILSTYATILLIALPIWIHEDRQYKLRAPSS